MYPMERYTIVGSSESGKSTLAKRISPYAVSGSLVTLPWIVALSKTWNLFGLRAQLTIDTKRYLNKIAGLDPNEVYASRREHRSEWVELTQTQCSEAHDPLHIIRTAYEWQQGHSIQVHDGFRLDYELELAKMCMGVKVIAIENQDGRLPDWVRPELVDYRFPWRPKPFELEGLEL